jgi:hypothetical protein
MAAVNFYCWLAPEGIANNGDGSFLEEAAVVDGVSCCRITTGAERYIELDTYNGEHTDLDLDTCCWSLKFRFEQVVTGDLNGDAIFMAVNAAGNPLWAAFLGSDRRLRFARADLNLIPGAVIDPLSVATWYEARIKAARSTGALDVWVYTAAGVLVTFFTVSASLGTGTHAKLRVGQCSTFNASNFGRVDCGPVDIDDDEPADLGLYRNGIKLPAATPVSGWAPSEPGAGDELHLLLGDNPYDPDTYVSSAVVNAQFLVSFASNASAGLNIRAVRNVRFLARMASPTAEGEAAMRTSSDGTAVDSATFVAPNAGAAVTAASMVLPADPSTSAAWVPAQLDEVQYGAVKKTDTNEVRAYDAYMFIQFEPEDAVASPAPPAMCLGIGLGIPQLRAS